LPLERDVFQQVPREYVFQVHKRAGRSHTVSSGHVRPTGPASLQCHGVYASQPERLYILSGPFFQRFFLQKIGEVSRPVQIEWGTIRPNPVFLCARPVGFPKTTGLFGGIADIHGFHQGTPFYFNRLGKNQAWNDR